MRSLSDYFALGNRQDTPTPRINARIKLSQRINYCSRKVIVAKMPKINAAGDPYVRPYMLGKIAIEEAIHIPETAAQAAYYSKPGTGTGLEDMLLDIHGERLDLMNANNVEHFTLSLTSPGPQGVANKEEAEHLAKIANDYMAQQVKKNPKRFSGFASLSMHDPKQAAQELRRAVKELGLVGCMINDFQSAGPNGETMLMYDQPEYDPFWAAAEELDTVVYMHPRLPAPHIQKELWDGRKALLTAPLSFGQDVQRHTLGLCVNGVFDRFPKVKFVIGHMGEMIPAHLWRLDHWMVRKFRYTEMKAKFPVRYYFSKNIWITTSGHYSTANLQNAINEIGADRIIFSIDHPYEDIEEGSEWWDGVPLNPNDKVNIGRNNAIRLLKLDLPLMGPEAVFDGLNRNST